MSSSRAQINGVFIYINIIKKSFKANIIKRRLFSMQRKIKLVKIAFCSNFDKTLTYSLVFKEFQTIILCKDSLISMLNDFFFKLYIL